MAVMPGIGTHVIRLNGQEMGFLQKSAPEEPSTVADLDSEHSDP